MLYVNRGLGTTGPPVRIAVAPEIAVLALRRRAAAKAQPGRMRPSALRSTFRPLHLTRDRSASPTLFALSQGETRSAARVLGTADPRFDPGASLPRSELMDQMPAFVVEIIAALNPDTAPQPTASDNAEEHGAQRLRLGFDVGEVVREYGLLHECIVDLAEQAGLTLTVHEQRVVAKWLNAGIADAVAQYGKQRDLELQRQASEHLGFIAHELRNPMSAAMLAFRRLKTGRAGARRPRRRSAGPRPQAHPRHDRRHAGARVDEARHRTQAGTVARCRSCSSTPKWTREPRRRRGRSGSRCRRRQTSDQGGPAPAQVRGLEPAPQRREVQPPGQHGVGARRARAGTT